MQLLHPPDASVALKVTITYLLTFGNWLDILEMFEYGSAQTRSSRPAERGGRKRIRACATELVVGGTLRC